MLRTSLTLFRVFGIPVEVNISWFIIFALVAWSLVSLYFPTNYPEMPVPAPAATIQWPIAILSLNLFKTCSRVYCFIFSSSRLLSPQHLHHGPSDPDSKFGIVNVVLIRDNLDFR